MMRSLHEMKIKFRLRLNAESWGTYKKGDEDDFVIPVFDELNGLVRYPIHDRWDIVSYELIKPKNVIEEMLIGCRDEFKPALRTWLEYKAEKNQRYKPKGLESLVKKFNKFEGTPDQLMHVIESCMECNYAGIVWSKKYTYGNVTKQTRIENFEQGFREQFAGKDLSANDGF